MSFSSILTILLILIGAGSQPDKKSDPVASLVTGYSHKIIFFEKTGKTILVNGGPEGGGTSITNVGLWEFSGNDWKLISEGPPIRNWFAAAYDSEKGYIYVYGGATPAAVLNDFWRWDGTAWTQVNSPAGPGPRVYAKMVYDQARKRIILFGGDKNENQIVNETWEFDGSSWTQAQGESPEPRLPGAMCYDPIRKKTVLYGGLKFDQSMNRTDYNDTWEFDGKKWIKVYDGKGALTAKIHPEIAFNPVDNKVWLIGGAIHENAILEAWSWNGFAWTKMNNPGQLTPRSGLSMEFNKKDRTMILHGGFTKIMGKPENDTWIGKDNTWTCAFACP